MSIWGGRVDALFTAGLSAKRTRLLVAICAGVLIAAIIGITEWRTRQQANDLDCSNQRIEVLTGDRGAVDSDCIGR